MYKLVSIITLFLLAVPLPAQVPQEVRRFQQSAGERTTLFRGKQAERYLFPANGNPYWERAEFFGGDIVVRGRHYYDIQLNVDAVAQLALVQVPGSQAAVSLSPAVADSLITSDRVFVGVSSHPYLPDGIYEVFGAGPEQVYKSTRKHLSTSTGNVNGTSIGYYDEHYRNDITRYFEVSVSYYFKDASGGFSRLRGKGALLRKFPERRKDVRRALRDTRLDVIDTPFDKYCKFVLSFVQQ